MEKNTKRLVLALAITLLVSRLSFVVVGPIFRQKYLDKSKPFPSWTHNSNSQVLNSFTSWDSGFFYDIATKGYPRVESKAATAELTVPVGMWVKVFLGSGSIGEEKTALPSSVFNSRTNNTVFLIGSGYEDTQVPIHYAYKGIPYCAYKGPINYERDVKVVGESLVNPTSCGSFPCDKSYVTYYSVGEGKVLYQEVFENGDPENPKHISGNFRPSGFNDKNYEGLGCNAIEDGDLKYYPDPNYEKVVTPYPYMPLYSYLSKSLSYVLGDVVLSGVLISILMFSISVLFLYKFLSLYFDKKVCFWACLAYALYPFGFGGTVFLATGLYNALLFGALYFSKIKHTLVVSILVALLALTGISGILVLIPIFFIYKSGEGRRGIADYALIIAVPLMALLVHFANLQSLSGDWLVFLKSRNAWFAGPQNIFEAAFNYFRYADKYALFETSVYLVLLAICVRFVNYLGSKGQKLAPELIIFMIYSFVLPFANGGLTSFPRFSTSNFFVFLALGYLMHEKPKSRLIVLTLCYVLSLLFFGLWTISSRFVV